MTWIVPQSIRSAYVRASACSTLESPPPLSGSDSGPVLRPCVNGKPTPRPSSWHGWKTRPWSRALFGQAICETSTPGRFAAWWTSSLRACRANRIQSQESNSATPTSEATAKTDADRSRNSCESWKSVDPPWCSARTYLPGFEEDSSGQSERNYADWVTRSKTRSLSLRNRLARAIEGSECSSWPTIRSHEVGQYQNQTDGTRQPTLTGASMNWPSPTAHDGRRPGADLASTQGANLNRDAATWPTPDAHPEMPNTSKNRGKNHGGERPRLTPCGLGPAVKIWPVPLSTDHKSGSVSESTSEKNSRPLNEIATQWGTPQANERSHSPREVDHGVQLANQVFGFSLPAPTQTGEPSPSTSGRRQQTRKLNARFVEWIMGMPISWTEI